MAFDLKKNEQSLKTSDNSTAIQAGGNVIINNGVSYENVEQIFKVLSQPLLQSSAEEARKIVEARLNEFMDTFLQDLEKHHVTNLNFAKEPRFHFCLSDAQKAYAKSGDKDILAILSKMLAEMAKSNNNHIRDFVLEQSVQILQKLDSRLLNVLSLCFIFQHTRSHGLTPINELYKYFSTHIKPIYSSLTEDSSVDYLTSCGCGNHLDLKRPPLEEIITYNYRGFFIKGFTRADVEAKGLRLDNGFFELIHGSPEQYYVPLSSELEYQTPKLSSGDIQKYQSLMEMGCYKPQQVKQILNKNIPYFNDLFQNWDLSGMRYFQLNAVGKTLALNWLKKNSSTFADMPLEDWVP